MSAPSKPRRVGVLLGGLSSERPISLLSGGAAAQALRGLGYDVVEIDVGRDAAETIKKAGIDTAFIALHGAYGEDGCIQGMLEIMGIPYTGSGVAASAVAMDKLLTKRVISAAGVPTPDYEVLSPEGPWRLPFPLPVAIKPNRGGSSIGTTVVREPEALDDAIRQAFREDPVVFAERGVKGREVTVSVLNGTPLPIVEVTPAAGVYTYTAKYDKNSGTRYHVPADLPADVAAAVSAQAAATYQVLGCAGAARVDVMLDEALRPWVLEINTIPGLTAKSLLPMAAKAVGLEFPQLVETILLGARRP